MVNELLLGELEALLGKGTNTSKDNYAFYCPFCNHKKKKLEVDLHTDRKGRNRYACWVCKTRGKTVKSLLYRLKVPKQKRERIIRYAKPKDTSLLESTSKRFFDKNTFISLPSDFKSLHNVSSSSYLGKKALSYLTARGVTELDIKRYNLGYCVKGRYSEKIIIPSYDSKNQINFFVGRSFSDAAWKYDNPKTDKELIFFENQINWDLPIILVEGVFDAIAIRHNAIPLLGSSMSKTLMKRLVTERVQQVYVLFDSDAKKAAFYSSMKLLDLGVEVFLTSLDEDDPADLGFHKMVTALEETSPLTTSEILRFKFSL